MVGSTGNAITRPPAVAPQNPGPEVAQAMVRFEAKEVIEVHRVMHCPEAIFSSGSFGFLFRIGMGFGKIFSFF
jgi:hypothetical protein